MTRWLITGASGMLGRDLQVVLHDRDVMALSHADLDVTNAEAVSGAVAQIRPDIVVNSAAWTAVDAAEDHEAEAFAVNALGAANVATACVRTGARMVQLSTDYVFDGTARTPYTEEASINPRSAYGRTKAAGEWAVAALLDDHAWIVRTAWLFGVGGSNFVKTMVQLEKTRDTVEVVDDQRGQPTWSRHLSQAIVQLVDAQAPGGVYHGTSRGETTWYGLARAIFAGLGTDPERVLPTTTDRYPRPAPRPAYSVLGHASWAKVSLSPFPHWEEALHAALPLLRGSH